MGPAERGQRGEAGAQLSLGKGTCQSVGPSGGVGWLNCDEDNETGRVVVVVVVWACCLWSVASRLEFGVASAGELLWGRNGDWQSGRFVIVLRLCVCFLRARVCSLRSLLVRWAQTALETSCEPQAASH